MIRLLFYVFIAGIFALAVSWLAAQDGQTVISWQGMKIELATSLAIGLIIAALLAVGVVFWLIRQLLSWPGLIAHNWQSRRRREGEKALALGMVAFAAGDIKGARRQAKKSQRLLGSGILPELLSAQAAHAAGDIKAAKRYFESLAEVKQTAYFGQIGLMRLYHAQGDVTHASQAAHNALGLEAQSVPALLKLLADDIQARAWDKAYHKLENIQKITAGDKDKQGLFSAAHPHQITPDERQLASSGQLNDMGLLAAHLALLASEQYPQEQAEWLKKSVKQGAAICEPHLRLAALEAQKSRKAAQKILEKAFIHLPHIQLAEQLREVTDHNDGQHVAHIGRLAEKSQHPDWAQLVAGQLAWQYGIWAAASAALSAVSEQGRTNQYYLLQSKIAQALIQAGLDEPALGKEEALTHAATAAHGPGWYCAGCGQSSGVWQDSCGGCGVVGQIGWIEMPYSESRLLTGTDKASAAI